MHPKGTGLVLCPLLPEESKRVTQAQLERNAKDYSDSLTLEQELWVLRKMGFDRMGARAEPPSASSRGETFEVDFIGTGPPPID